MQMKPAVQAEETLGLALTHLLSSKNLSQGDHHYFLAGHHYVAPMQTSRINSSRSRSSFIALHGVAPPDQLLTDSDVTQLSMVTLFEVKMCAAAGWNIDVI